jgi:hypothetical protein
MKAFTAMCLALVVLLAFPGCRSRADKEKDRDEKRSASQAEMKARIPPDSPLARVDFGMTEGEVGSILGAPDSQDTHTTGKQFIPFNFAAKDTIRTVYYFKGVGRVEFSSGSWGQRNGVVILEYDPEEPGFRRRK